MAANGFNEFALQISIDLKWGRKKCHYYIDLILGSFQRYRRDSAETVRQEFYYVEFLAHTKEP